MTHAFLNRFLQFVKKLLHSIFCTTLLQVMVLCYGCKGKLQALTATHVHEVYIYFVVAYLLCIRYVKHIYVCCITSTYMLWKHICFYYARVYNEKRCCIPRLFITIALQLICTYV